MKDPVKVAVKGPLGPYAAGFCAELDGLGYAGSSAVNVLKLVAHLSQWMGSEGLTVRELSPEEVERYVAARRAAGYRHNPAAWGLGTLLSYLRRLGVLPEVAPSGAPTGQERVLQDYAGYLVSERGLKAGTVRYYLRFAGLFLSSVARGGEFDVDTIATGDVSSFLVDQCGRRSVGSAKTLVMALRALLGYLHVAGLSATPLVGAVPAVAPWRERSVPRALAPSAVARLLASCDRRTTVGELLVRGKGDRRERLPLPVDVGEALAGYLRQGRPRCTDRHVFLRVKAPTMGLHADGVTKVVHAACLRAGVPVVGAHRLRRATACETLRQGGSLAEVGEVLRQRSASTQALYAKVDHAALERVARPWPGARP